MKTNKLLAIVLCVAMIVTQFAMLGVSAETTDTTVTYEALTGREEFLMGVNIHHFVNTPSYTETYSALCDAENLGSNIIRINGSPADAASYSYFKSVADAAADKGMQTMLANVGFSNYISVTETVDGVKTTRPLTVEELDLAAITAHYTEMATAFKGSIKYYQLGNEMDNIFYTGGGFGRTYNSGYADVTVAAMAIDAAAKAIKSVDPDAKVIVNFVSQHLGFIHGLKSVDIDSATEGVQTASWDYIGMDWYSNMRNTDSINPEDNEPYDYIDNINDLAVYDEPIIICEANRRPKGWLDEEQTQVDYSEDVSWLADFLTYCYGSQDVLGFIAYELFDEPEKRAYDEEGNEIFYKEAHYGLIDKDGNKKDAYNVLQALYGGTDVARDTITAPTGIETLGEPIKTAFNTVEESKIYKNFNYKENNVKDSTIITATGFEAVDFSEAEYIEFDFYVEDVNALKAAMENAGASLRFYLKANTATRWAQNITMHLLKRDGWNHIVLKKSDFSKSNGSDPWSAVDTFQIAFDGILTATGAATYMNATSGMKVAVSNLQATKLTRTTESTVGTLIENQLPSSTIVGKFGDSSGYANDNGAYSYRKQNLTATDLSTAEYFEFDIYVNDYDALMTSLKQDINGNALSLDLVFSISSNATGTDSNNYYRYNLASQITHSGWNHIVLKNVWGSNKSNNLAVPIKAASFSAAAIKSYGIRFITKVDATIPAGFDLFAMTNVIATKRVVPTENTFVPSEITLPADTSLKALGTKFIDTGTQTKATISSTNISTVDYIEFDFFVESYGALKKEMEAKGPTGMNLLLSSNADDMFNTAIKLPFFDQVKHSGWNHIVVPNTTSDQCDESAIVAYYVYFSGTNSSVNQANANANMNIALANIQGTSIAKPEMDNVAVNEIAIYEDMKSESLGSNFNSAIRIELNNAINIKFGSDNPTYIEFDLFVQDYDKFISAAANNDLVLRISSSAESYNLDSLTVRNVQQYITKSGWNHIQIPFANFAKGSTSGTFDAAAFKQCRFYFGGTATNSTGEAKGLIFAVANLAATADMIIPDEVMPEHNAIIDDVQTITIGGEGNYMIDLSASPKDISKDNLFEMDVYVQDTALTSLTVMFVDATGEATATHTFTELVYGWNHLALRLDDFDYVEGFDKEQVIACVLLAEAGAKITVANFYTATYVKGDGNRDGLLDIRDLVAMKKYAIGITLASGMTGNGVAMDVKGDDYKVNAQDLSALRCYLLTDKWPEN